MDKYCVEDIPIKKLDFKFITDYEFWLKATRKCNHNSAIKYFNKLQKDRAYLCAQWMVRKGSVCWI